MEEHSKSNLILPRSKHAYSLRDPADRLPGLNTLRFILAIWVVLIHYSLFLQWTGTRFSQAELPLYQYLGWFYAHWDEPVPIFWAVSGAVFAVSYPNSTVFNTKRFLVARFARLFPLHWIALGLTISIHLLHFYILQEFTYKLSFPVIAFNIMLIQRWLPLFNESLNGPSWSISVEILTYVVFALYRIVNYLWADLFIVVLSTFLLMFSHTEIRNSPYLSISLFFITRRLVQIVLLRSKYVTIYSLLSLLLSSIVLHVCCPEYSILSKAPLVVIVTILIYGKYSNFVDPKFIGDITYSLYLIHAPIMSCISFGVKYLKVDGRVVLHPIFYTSYFCLLIAISSLSFYHIEKKFRASINEALCGN